jgi:hypothetical protein
MKRDSLAEQGSLLSKAQNGAGGLGVSDPSGITFVIGLTPMSSLLGSQARRAFEIQLIRMQNQFSIFCCFDAQ